MSTGLLEAAGIILAFGVACGLDLYITIALLGIASRLAWADALPDGLRGLENRVVIGSAVVLFFIEFIIDRVPYFDSLWDALHTLVRPLTATLLALLALDDQAWQLQVAGGGLAGAAATLTHASKAGFRVILNARPRLWRTFTTSFAEDVLALGLLVTAMTRPALAAIVAAAALLLAISFGARLWRAAYLAVRAAVARLRGFFGHAGWRGAAQMPAPLRSLLQPERVGIAPARAARAAVAGIPTAGAYRNGWLVVEKEGPIFLFRSLGRPRRVDLPRARPADARVHHALLTDMLEVGGAAPFTVFLLKDGPSPEVAVSDLVAAP